MTVDGQGRLYRFGRHLVRLMSRRYRVIPSAAIHPETLQEPVVFISRHQNLFGPWKTMLWFPGRFRVWVYHVFLEPQTAFRHYVNYTFTKRFGWHQSWAKIVAWPVSYVVTAVLRSAACIPVYRGTRQIVQTFRETVRALADGYSVFIFPDIEYQDRSAQTGELYKGFLQLDKYMYRETGRHVCFVPMYVCRRQRAFFVGDPIRFRDGEDFQKEREVVYQKIRDGLDRLAGLCGEL
ncbi:MAG: glycerol acyltransferase [Bacillota bacterium]|nr:glycerol acyltransferase [Bacillota bacterium]